MSLPTTDRTKLNNLSPNLVPQQIAVSALRLAVFQEIYTYLDNIITDLNAAQATGAVTTPKLADGGVTTLKLADNAVTGAKLLDAAVIASKLADGSVTTQKVGDGAVVTIKLADGAVVTAKIADLNITSGKIADNAIVTVKLADGAVLSAKIADGAVTSLKIADGGVTGAKIADNTITTQKLVDSIITAAKILDGSVTNAKLAPGSVTGDKVANGAINSQHMDPALLASAASLSVQSEFDKRAVSIEKYSNLVAAGDWTAAIQAALAAVPSAGGIVFFPPGANYTVSNTLTTSKPNTTILIPAGAKITATFSDKSVIVLNATGCVVEGEGVIESPAVWNPLSGGTQWTYAVVMIKGNDCTVKDITINNVPVVGVGAQEVNNTKIRDIKVYGNMTSNPSGNTGHFGITIDPPLAYPGGFISIEGCTVAGCVEGIFTGNYGSGVGYGIDIVGNTLRDCFDHGIYAGIGPKGVNITGNWFFNCANPIAMTGENNSAVGNTIYYDGNGPVVTFGPTISARDAKGNIIANNTVYNLVAAGTSFVIIQSLSGSNIENNMIVNNFVDSGPNPALAIRIVNTAPAPVSKHNVVSGNIIKGAARANFGIISMTTGNSGNEGRYNAIENNHIIVTGSESSAWGIQTSYEKGASIKNNTVEMAFNASAAIVFRGIRLENTSESVADNNTVSCLTGFGTNVTATGINEASPSANNHLINNKVFLSSTNLTSPLALNVVSQVSRTKLSSTDTMFGAATITTGASNVTVTNANVAANSRILVTPTNAEAGKKPFYVLAAAGSFTINIGDGTTVAAAANYAWEIA